MPAFADGYRADGIVPDGCLVWDADPVDPRGLHAEAVVVDTHDDLLMLTSRQPRAQQSDYFRTSWLPQLREGGIDVQVLPVYIDDDNRPEGALRQTLRMVESGWTIAEGNPDEVAVCLTGAEVDEVVASGRSAFVLALEGCEAGGKDVELLSTLYRVGVRIASLTHFGRTLLADGSGEDPAGARGASRLPLVTEELVGRGWSEDDIRAVLGGNDLRLFRAELGVPLSARG